MGFVKLTDDTMSCLKPGHVYSFTNVKYLKRTLYYSPMHAQYRIQIIDAENIENVKNPDIITNHDEKSFNGLTLKIKHALISIMRYNKKWNDLIEDDDKTEDIDDAHSFFHSIRQMFNEESKHVNNSTNILALIQDSNNYTSQSGKHSFIFRLSAEGKIIDCCQWNLPEPPDNTQHVLPTQGFAIFIDVKFTKWGKNYHYLYSKNSSVIYDFCPSWIKMMKGNIDSCIDDRIHYIWVPYHKTKENHAFIKNIRIREMHNFGQIENYIKKNGESANLKIGSKNIYSIAYDNLQLSYKCLTCNTSRYNNITYGCCGKMNPNSIRISCKLDICMENTVGSRRIHVAGDALVNIIELVCQLPNPKPPIPEQTRVWYKLLIKKEAKIMNEDEIVGLTPALQVFCENIKDTNNIIMMINGVLLGNYSNKTLWFFLKKVWFEVDKTRKRNQPPHIANDNVQSDIKEPPSKKHKANSN